MNIPGNVRLQLSIFFLLLTFSPPVQAVYIHRYTAIGQRGAMTFTGNTLGLSKAPNRNQPGTSGAIGAYISTDTGLRVGSFPFGTTLDYTQNSSAAVLDLPAGSTVLHAELIWSGSYGYERPGVGEDPAIVLGPADGPITFTTPDLTVHQVTSDSATRQHSQNASPTIDYDAGNYTRSADVTSLVGAAGAGTYIAGGIPSTISPLDNAHNAAGWTLAVIYRHPSFPVQNMTLLVGCEQALDHGAPVAVEGFCTPPSGPLEGRLLISAIEGDATRGDQMAFGMTPTTLSNLSGPNNRINSFFSSQINDDNGNLDTSGTFGNRNQNASAGRNISAGRQGYDITNVDIGATLSHGQSQGYVQGATSVGSEDFVINALGIQIGVSAPIIDPVELVNGKSAETASLGDILTLSSTLTNTGDDQALSVVFKNDLGTELALVPGTFTVNGAPIAHPDLVNGTALANLAVGQSALIAFQVQIVSYPHVGNTFFNASAVEFDFIPCSRPLHNAAVSNFVRITLPEITPPREFTGGIYECVFLDTTRYTLKTSWQSPLTRGATFYRIYDGKKLMAQIPATAPLKFETCLNAKTSVENITLVAVYPGGRVSHPTPLICSK